MPQVGHFLTLEPHTSRHVPVSLFLPLACRATSQWLQRGRPGPVLEPREVCGGASCCCGTTENAPGAPLRIATGQSKRMGKRGVELKAEILKEGVSKICCTNAPPPGSSDQLTKASNHRRLGGGRRRRSGRATRVHALLEVWQGRP